MTDRIGHSLGKYRLVRLLGSGGFAEVYLAEHQHLGTQTAIKLLHAQLASARESEQFRQEARTVATLLHPNIIRVLDFDVEEGTPYLVLEYAPNGSLRQRFPAGMPLAPATLLPFVKQVAEALQYAHERKLIHRDIKPENMLLGRHQEVVLSDFGIAVVAESTSMQKTQGVAGTAAYMAPEQLQGKPRPASDLYSLGVVVYEWLTGERPFRGSFTEVASQHLFTPPPSLREKVPTLSPALEQVVLTALAKDPKERFGSVQAFATAFEQTTHTVAAGRFQTTPSSLATRLPPPGSQPTSAPLTSGPSTPSIYHATTQVTPAETTPPVFSWPGSGAPTLAPSATMNSQTSGQAPTVAIANQTPPQPRRGLSRRRILGGLALGVVAVGGGALAWSIFPARPNTSVVLTPSSTQTPAPPTPTPLPPGSTLYIYRQSLTQVWTVAWSPNGQFIASGSGLLSRDGVVRIWEALTGNTRLTYTGHTSEVYSVAWSPDGTRIASGGNDRTVQVWDATTGGNVYAYTGHVGPIKTVAWSPTGQLLASASFDGTMQIWEASSGTQIHAYDNALAKVYGVAWAPDGRRIAFGGEVHPGDGQTVQVWDVPSGTRLVSYRGHADTVVSVAWSPDGRKIASASFDRTVQVWDAATGAPLLTYPGHSDLVVTASWSPNGKQVASGGVDTTAQVWDAVSGATLLTYTRHQSEVYGLEWSPEGKRIVSGSRDHTAQIWVGL